MDCVYKKKYNHSNNIINSWNIIKLKKIIFPPIADNLLSHLHIDQESYKFITFASSAQEITNIIMNSLIDFPCPKRENEITWQNKNLIDKMEKLVITEMTAGVGGNVFNFAKYFKYVNAIEIDNIRHHYLTKNINLYGFSNVNCYNEDSVDFLVNNNNNIAQDIVFFDPPWGGSGYKNINALRLDFGENSIENICHLLFQRECTKMIVIKLPNNYDFNYLKSEMYNYRITLTQLDKMTIIVLKNYNTLL